jgi:hypothetical protein
MRSIATSAFVQPVDQSMGLTPSRAAAVCGLNIAGLFVDATMQDLIGKTKGIYCLSLISCFNRSEAYPTASAVHAGVSCPILLPRR